MGLLNDYKHFTSCFRISSVICITDYSDNVYGIIEVHKDRKSIFFVNTIGLVANSCFIIFIIKKSLNCHFNNKISDYSDNVFRIIEVHKDRKLNFFL